MSESPKEVHFFGQGRLINSEVAQFNPNPFDYLEWSAKNKIERLRDLKIDIGLHGRIGRYNGVAFVRNGNEMGYTEAFGQYAIEKEKNYYETNPL